MTPLKWYLVKCCKKDSLADKWVQIIKLWETYRLDDFESLSRHFLNHFKGKTDRQQKVDLQAGLYQRPQESIHEFFQRAYNAAFIICDDIEEDQQLCKRDMWSS